MTGETDRDRQRDTVDLQNKTDADAISSEDHSTTCCHCGHCLIHSSLSLSLSLSHSLTHLFAAVPTSCSEKAVLLHISPRIMKLQQIGLLVNTLNNRNNSNKQEGQLPQTDRASIFVSLQKNCDAGALTPL